MPEREKLYERINGRVDEMMALGLMSEVEKLVSQGSGPSIKKARVIGYAEILDYLDGRTSLDEAISLIKQNSRRYAKRQLTWFRGQIEGKFYTSSEGMLVALRKRLAEKQ